MKAENMSNKVLAGHLQKMTATGMYKEAPPAARAVFEEAINRLAFGDATVTDTSDQARENIVRSLRRMADRLEAGAEVLAGGAAFVPGDEGDKLISDLVVCDGGRIDSPTPPKIDKAFLKDVATEFYYWWHNQPGQNTEQGFDEWWRMNHLRFLPQGHSHA